MGKKKIITFSKGTCTSQTYVKADGRAVCYFLLNRGLTWILAHQGCTALGARLSVINSLQENQIIFDLMVNINLIFLILIQVASSIVMLILIYSTGHRSL